MPAAARRQPNPEPSPAFAVAVERKAFDLALKRVAGVLEGRQTVPILAHIRLVTGADDLTVQACDGDRDIKVRVPADISGEGDLCLPGQTLVKIVGAYPVDAQVGLRADPDGRNCTVASGRSRYKLPALPGSDFPRLDSNAAGHEARFALSGKTLADMLSRLSFAVSTEQTRYYLCGIYWTVLDDARSRRLAFVATNGNVLARLETPAPDGLVELQGPSQPGIIVPDHALPILAKIASSAESVVFTASSAYLVAEAGETRFLTKLVDGTFPDYQRVIPTLSGRDARIDRDETIAALERIAALDEGGGSAIAFDPDDNGLALTRRQTGGMGGEGSESIGAEVNNGLSFGASRRLALACLSAFRGESVTLDQHEPGSPIRILGTSEADAGFDAVLMPRRV